MSRYEELGRAIGDRQDALRKGAPTKARTYRALFARRAISPRRPAWPIAVAVAAATVVVLTLTEWWMTEPVMPRGDYAAAPTAPRRIDFPGGTSVTLKPGSVARVEHADEHGAVVVLQEGSLYAEVVKRGARWYFRAGAYTVEVTGTAFDLTWTAPRLTLVMHEGSVRVTGPELSPTTVVAGEQLVLPRPAPERSSPTSPQFPASPPESPESPASPAAPVATATAVASASPSGPRWQAAAAAGDHAGAYAAAAPRLDEELATLDAGSMLRLATVARLSGHPATAGRVYRRLRQRFPGTGASAEAAFALGSLAFSSNGTEAERWFRTALIEAPGGGLRASARGRLLELAQRRGDAAAAAEDYLRHHPEGPHAALARQILAR